VRSVRDAMNDTLLRQLFILQQIPRAPRKVDTRTLARALEARGLRVTRRTLQRDVEKLSRAFPLVCADDTKPFGWSWRADAPLPLWVADGVAVRAKAELLLGLMERKFGALPSDVRERVLGARSEEVDAWAARLLDAVTVEEMLG